MKNRKRKKSTIEQYEEYKVLLYITPLDYIYFLAPQEGYIGTFPIFKT